MNTNNTNTDYDDRRIEDRCDHGGPATDHDVPNCVKCENAALRFRLAELGWTTERGPKC